MNEGTRYSIAIVLVTYNSDPKKTLRTLSSVLIQKDVDIELIIADDGSEDDNYLEISEFLETQSGAPYTFIRKGCNVGTVLNAKEAIDRVSSEFVKIISPGDYLYDESTICNMIKAMEESKADLSFGNAVHYSEDSELKVFDIRNPVVISPYKSKNRSKILNSMIGHKDYILGASMLFRTDSLRRCLTQIAGRVIYCEDFSAQLLILEGGVICYIDDFVEWYETGTGISTNYARGYSEKMSKDACEFFTMAKRMFPESKAVNLAYKRENYHLSKRSGIGRLAWYIRHPSDMVFKMKAKLLKRLYKCEGFDIGNYNRILETEFQRNALT